MVVTTIVKIAKKPYEKVEEHYCPDPCPVCRRRNCIKELPLRCPHCCRLCRSDECFAAHKSVQVCQGFSLYDLGISAANAVKSF